jgi:hypothetical protein
MKFSVIYEDGFWTFSIESIDPSSDYYEEFEITDENEAKTAAMELVEEIAAAMDDEDLDGAFGNVVPRS